MLTPRRVKPSFVWSDRLAVNYLLNAKAGCGTIKAALWKLVDPDSYEGEPHGPLAPFRRLREMGADEVEAMLAKPTFTVVRNPFARALSAYTEKLLKPVPTGAGTIFRQRFGFGESEPVSFVQYLRFVATDEEPDRHWATQADNLLQPEARIDHVFYLEDGLAGVEGLLGCAIPAHDRGRTDAVSRLAEYTPEAVELVRSIYAADLALLGYSGDPTVQAPLARVSRLPGRPGVVPGILKPRAMRRATAALTGTDG